MKRITLIEELERGPYGILYRAHDERSGRAVTVRVPPLGWPQEATLMAASQASGLRHPHIAPVLEAGWHDGRAYVVLGEELGEVLKPGELRAGIAAARDVARAIEYAAARGVAHPGLAPDLIHRAADGRWVVSGYELPGDPRPDSGFRAPEFRAGGAVDVPANIYSLAALLNELTWDVARPDELEALLLESRDPDPAKRPSPTAFLAGLRRCEDALGPSKEDAWDAVPLRAPVLAGGGLLLLLSLVGFLPGHEPAPPRDKASSLVRNIQPPPEPVPVVAIELPPEEGKNIPESFIPPPEEGKNIPESFIPAPEPVVPEPPPPPPQAPPAAPAPAPARVGQVTYVHQQYGVFVALDAQSTVAVGDALEVPGENGVARLTVRKISRPERLYPHGAVVCDASADVLKGQVVRRVSP